MGTGWTEGFSEGVSECVVLLRNQHPLLASFKVRQKKTRLRKNDGRKREMKERETKERDEEVDALHLMTKEAKMDDMEDELAVKTQAVEELSRELEEIRACFGSEGIHQLQDFEAALKQRDGIITQLTSNLQQARDEKEDIMREFLQMTEQSHKLHIQFQQLQAGETLRNTTHSSTAADLLQARQQMVQYQQQLEDLGAQVRKKLQSCCVFTRTCFQ
uniref:Uncharacterized protein n=1 Tax=Gadus morhua TaxID=8049 RepID=A0A8C5CVX4_GADMO